MSKNRVLTQNLQAPAIDGGDDISPTDTRPRVVESYLRLFGQLPDIIRLHEQTGDFDGQVVFIGHPNRDVSAHQWFSASFQWINIGLWSHNRKKIEGSLASDQSMDSGHPSNTVEKFKRIAELRETVVKQHGCPELDAKAEVTRLTNSDSALSNSRETSKPMLAAAIPACRTVTGEKLEDPFVSTNGIAQPVPMVAFNFHGATQVGSMDFTYEFPSKASGTNKENHQVYIQRERERLESLTIHSSPHQESPSLLREVEFGEEAATGFTPPDSRSRNDRHDTLSPMRDMHSLLRGGGRPVEGTQQMPRPGLPVEHRVAIPDFSATQISARNSIPKGPTVANPYRGVSRLNAAATPYQMPTKAESSEDSSSSVTALNFAASTIDPSLRFSDPDARRQDHTHPIANGFNKQAPTKQNWNGPFFADSMPTTHDPTASLSFRTTNEQKLSNWYRDGQTVVRQQDYAKTLIMAATASHKARNWGVIGEGSIRQQTFSKYENTHLFARLYENLSGYAEESRAGGSSNYFTRAWKAPAMHLRDLGPDGNNSFYEGTRTPSPRLSRASSRPYQPYRGDSAPWGFAALGSSPFPAPYGSSLANSKGVDSVRRGF